MTRISAAAQAALEEVGARLARRIPALALALEPPGGQDGVTAPLASRPLVLVGRVAHGSLDPTLTAALVESAAAEVDAILDAATVRARAEQLAREIEVLRLEHQEIVEHNLREHDRVLAAERQDAMRLERLVCERTAELEHSNRQLSAASSLKDRFLWHISHEVRTPLHGLVGHLDLLRDTPLDAGQRELVGLACGAAEALRAVVCDVVDFSRLEAGLLALEPADFELRLELGALLKVIGPPEGRLGAELICDVKPDVPERLRADIGRIRQVLVNLVGNAMKFTAPGGQVRVSVELADPTERARNCALHRLLHVRVADTGIGIPYEKQAAVFEPFWQVDDSASRHFEGAGLGLALASRLVQKLGGRIWFESEPGHGTTFHFTLDVESRAEPRRAELATPWRGAGSPDREQRHAA
ncbi:MAG: hypothetical protein IPK07_04875 [Deltaproteobacteria bacterium]|nr:hypothetical protein [Deltaproteobacteria bacterium]